MVSIQKGLSQDLIGSAAELYLSVLWEKFTPVLGDDEKAVSIVASSIEPDSCFSALENDKRLKMWPWNKIIGWPFDESILMEYMVG